MKTISNDSEKEIEFRVYSNGEYIDIFKFHPVIGEKIWQALMDIAITGDLTALKRIAESNKLERFCQYVRDNAWQRYVFDDIRKRTPLNAYISPGVGGLTSDVQPTLVADAYRVGVVVHAVGTDHPFRPSRLDLSVTTDHVMVSYAEVETPIAMPCIDLSRRARLVRPHCRTMND